MTTSITYMLVTEICFILIILLLHRDDLLVYLNAKIIPDLEMAAMVISPDIPDENDKNRRNYSRAGASKGNSVEDKKGKM